MKAYDELNILAERAKAVFEQANATFNRSQIAYRNGDTALFDRLREQHTVLAGDYAALNSLIQSSTKH